MNSTEEIRIPSGRFRWRIKGPFRYRIIQNVEENKMQCIKCKSKDRVRFVDGQGYLCAACADHEEPDNITDMNNLGRWE